MARKLILLVSLFLVLSMNIAFGAILHGAVYDSSLDPLENAIVEVNSVPKQTYVSKQGSYSFMLPPGDYVIKATYESRAYTLVVQQDITIKDDGDYIADLILFPDISEEDELLNEDIDISDIEFEDKNNKMLIYVLVIAFFVILFLIYLKKIRLRMKKDIDKIPDETDEIINFIKKKGGRATQKEIRQEFPVSEAKISLMIAELEDKGKVRKIKRGKGNIIILNKK